ncbi:MAG TPA: ribosome maturation factor RimM [Rhodocyclaceae bacterium]|jgi:16S rRNA processing protein RimM|nr:ribosome maturation factor RimM [Rhodocyclaceae bacterium]
MIVLGRLVAPYGVRGWFKLHAFADDPAAWCALPQWWLAADAETAEAGWRMLKLETVREHGKGLIVKLEGVDDRTGAEALQGFYVGVPREVMPATDDDEFYWDDLIGLEVKNERGESLGRVDRMISAAASDVLVVTEGEGERANERLLPFVASVVLEVNVAAGEIRVAWERDW